MQRALGDTQVDAAKIVTDERNVLLACEGGVVLFIWSAPNNFEIVECWEKCLPIEYVQRAVLMALCWMYSHVDCGVILTKAPCVSLVARNPLIIETTAAVLQITDDRTCKVLRVK